MAAKNHSRTNTAERPETEPVNTERIGFVIQEVQHQLRALVYVARTDALEERHDGEALRTLAESISVRSHVMLDECLKKMGCSCAGNFEDSFADLDERRGDARG